MEILPVKCGHLRLGLASKGRATDRLGERLEPLKAMIGTLKYCVALQRYYGSLGNFPTLEPLQVARLDMGCSRLVQLSGSCALYGLGSPCGWFSCRSAACDSL